MLRKPWEYLCLENTNYIAGEYHKFQNRKWRKRKKTDLGKFHFYNIDFLIIINYLQQFSTHFDPAFEEMYFGVLRVCRRRLTFGTITFGKL